MISPFVFAGAATTAFSVLKAIKWSKQQDMYEILKYVFEECELYATSKDAKGNKVIKECRFVSIEKKDYGHDVTVKFPIGLTVSKLREKIEALEMALEAEILHMVRGREVKLQLGQVILNDVMHFNVDLLPKKKGIQVPIFTPFGVEYIDFGSEVSAHLLCGGASGMGKTKLIDLIILCIILQTQSTANIHLINNKLIDTAIFDNVKNVSIYEDIKGAEKALGTAIAELNKRKILFKKFGSVKLSEYNKQVDGGEHLSEWFVVIDEFARFSSFPKLQEQIIELSELGRSFGIHLIVGTQRPDADVLEPRIKANLMTKIALKTATASNSRVILEGEDAFHLPMIQGRAVIQRSNNRTIQVPYVPKSMMEELLLPFRVKGASVDDGDGRKKTKSVRNVTESTGVFNVPGSKTVLPTEQLTNKKGITTIEELRRRKADRRKKQDD